jgi:hypothetical protein
MATLNAIDIALLRDTPVALFGGVVEVTVGVTTGSLLLQPPIKKTVSKVIN